MKKSIYKYIFITLGCIFSCISLSGQENANPIFTTLPSLQIAPDARGGGLADVGAATAPDVYSQYWNPAKYAFTTSKAGIGVSYTPWLSNLIDDINLSYASGYYKIGSEEDQAISASIRYFSYGDVPIQFLYESFMREASPYEWAIDIGYSRKLTQTFSAAVVLRYMNADFSLPNRPTSNKHSIAADIAVYNESYVNIGHSECIWAVGVNISNIGPKVRNNDSYADAFLPTNLKVGGSLAYPIDDMSMITLGLDLNKLLVPTPPDSEDENYEEEFLKYQNKGSFSGIFTSFGDAPGGFSEELKEIQVAAGVEYAYNNMFKLRTGYSYENKMKGRKSYATFGAGLKFKNISLDASYLISTVSPNPLDKTLRCSLSYNF